MGSPTRTPRSGRPSRARSCTSSSGNRSSRPARRRESGSWRSRRPPSAITRRSARSVGAACWSGIELVADRDTREPFPRAARVTEAVVRAARERGLLVYSGTGNANGVDGDTILLGPPFVVTDAELERIATTLAASIEAATAASPQVAGRD